MKNIYLIMGESGSGKTTLVNELSKRYCMIPISSYTTRPPRSENEVGHIFVEEKDMPNEKSMMSYTYYNGYHYWVTLQQIEQSDLFVVDTKGIEFLKNKYSGDKKIKVIYIYVDEFIRTRRMYDRGDDYSQVIQRINHDRKAFAKVKADIEISNTNLEQTISKLYDYIVRCETCE